jgi:NAD(P)-dependent dehydrogenase (short-subunit alcohol dehydrogenase family)
MGQLAGKTAIVTGASRGIGRAIAEGFFAAGARVLATARSALTVPLPDAPGFRFQAGDMSRSGDVDALFATAEKHFGGIDVLVNNAGILFGKTIEETSEAEWDEIMAVNAKSMFLTARAALGPMRKQGGGSIVNIGSYSGYLADPNLAAYCASKGAVHALSTAIAVDHGRDNIRCNVICPGWIETDMIADYLSNFPDPAAARRNVNALHPIGRIGKPQDIAEMALFLASDAAVFITGQLFVVDGGLTAKAPQPV